MFWCFLLLFFKTYLLPFFGPFFSASYTGLLIWCWESLCVFLVGSSTDLHAPHLMLGLLENGAAFP